MPRSPFIQRIAHSLERAESILLGVLILFYTGVLLLIALGIIVTGSFGNIDYPRHLATPVAVLVLLFDGWLLLSLWDRLANRQFPLGPHVAESQPKIPVPLRGPVAFVWLAHTLPTLFVAAALHRALTRNERLPAELPAYVFFFLTTLAFTFLANVYITLALHTLAPHTDVRHRFWRRRLLIDLALALGTSLFSFFVRR